MNTAPDIQFVPLHGDLDVTSVPRLSAYLDSLVEGGCRRIILGMSDVAYMDSMGVALVFTMARRMRAVDGLISLTGVRPGVYHTLRLACLMDFIPVSELSDATTVTALDVSARPLWRRTIPVEPSSLAGTRRRVSELLSRMPLTPDDVFDMTLASGEALGNAIDHTCAQGVCITVSAYPDRVICEVSDCGLQGGEQPCGMGHEPIESYVTAQKPPETLAAASWVREATDASDDEVFPWAETGVPTLERGRGIKLMRMLADSVEIIPKTAGEGTVVRLVKVVDRQEHPTPVH